MYLHKLNVEYSPSAIVFWFFVLEEGNWQGGGRNLLEEGEIY